MIATATELVEEALDALPPLQSQILKYCFVEERFYPSRSRVRFNYLAAHGGMTRETFDRELRQALAGVRDYLAARKVFSVRDVF